MIVKETICVVQTPMFNTSVLIMSLPSRN